MGIAVTSCKQQGQQAQSEPVEAVETVVEEAAEPDPVDAFNTLLEKAKAEGENWSVDEWKEAYRQSFAFMAPHILKSAEFEKAVTEGQADSIINPETVEAIENSKKAFAALTPILEQFVTAMGSFPNGKAVMEDAEFLKAVADEFGIPDSFR